MKSVRVLWFTVALSVTITTYIWWKIQPSMNNLNEKSVQQKLYSLTKVYNELEKKFTKNRKPENVNKTMVENSPRKITIRNHKFKYIANMSTNSESTLDVAGLFMTPWKQNISNLQDLRSDLKKSIHTEMILSQKNVNISDRLKCTLAHASMNISEDLYRLLLQDSPERNVYKRCSIVGNGGILNGSKCGKEIDKADFVIRCNAPPINEFREDAGVKSNITTVNHSIVKDRFGSIRNHDQQSRFIDKMNEYSNYIWYPTFTNEWIYKSGIKINKLINTNLTSVKFVHGNPDHFREINGYWAKRSGMRRNRLSTGFYVTTTALLFCDEVHLYGFWPFSTDIHNRPAPYHYHEDRKMNRVVHAFNKEFNELARLHSEGVLQLHVDDCYRNTNIDF
ncbi:CMP-N-acetylneuraminate-poly-alpha-2,8-sialyltransferase-like [Antedon mediterranea]|uniref:CMP-N-acetylneuraminate-poly-alpha-2, 8-sialyltransferase-like n=1 Tax=Antedon mediterranea TaxID=105859 RepID=UPI003AF9E9FB